MSFSLTLYTADINVRNTYMSLDTELILSTHGFCSCEELSAMPHLNPHTQDLLEMVNTQNYAEMFNLLDSMRSFKFSESNFYIYKPCALNAIVYDCKVHNGAVFFAVFYALDNHISKVCQSNGFEYAPDKNLWYKTAPISENTDLNTLTKNALDPFLNDLTAFCHLAINKANLSVNYNRKLFF